MMPKAYISGCMAAVALCALGVSAQSLRAEMPLFSDIAETKAVGPQTEAVDRAAYGHVLHVSALAAPAPAAAVAVDGDGSKDKPFATIQAALDAAKDVSASQRYAILVAAGSYAVVDLQMREHVDLYGGFNAAWERDVVANATILDARQKGPVVRGANDARIDGFVITNGRHRGVGGGIVCDHVSPVISNNVIRQNVTIEPENFRRDMIHQQGHGGGGIALLAGSNAEVRGNLICGNTTGIGNGAGIFIWNECAKPKVRQNVICDNHAGVSGAEGKEGSRSSNGGGIAVSLSCAPEIVGNVVAMNTAADNSDAGGIYLEYDAHALIRGNWITGNFAADDGGGLYVMKASEPVFERNVLAGNRNTSNGSGAIRLSKEGRLRASHNLIVANPTGIDAVGSWMIFRNNTLVDCATSAIVFENQAEHFAPSRITANIFAGQMKQPIHLKPGPAVPDFSHNVVPGGFPGTGNADANLEFLDDSVRGDLVELRYDPARHVTAAKITGPQLAPDALAGRVVNVGQRWSVIQSNTPNELSVWGDITDANSARAFLILGTYQPAPASPGRDAGAYAKAP